MGCHFEMVKMVVNKIKVANIGPTIQHISILQILRFEPMTLSFEQILCLKLQYQNNFLCFSKINTLKYKLMGNIFVPAFYVTQCCVCNTLTRAYYYTLIVGLIKNIFFCVDQ